MSSNYLYLCFAFCYYICFVPYRFKRLKNGLYIIQTDRFQKVLCGTLHSLAMYLYSASFRQAVEGMAVVGTPVTYFRLFENVFSLLYKALVIKCIWLNRDVFLKIINFRGQQNFPVSKSRNKIVESTWFLIFVFSFHAMLSVMRLNNPSTSPLSQIPNREASSYGRFHDWYHSLVSEAHYLFFHPNHTETTYTRKLTFTASYSPFEIVMVGITAVALFCKYITGTFADVVLLMVVMSLWSPVTDFEKLLKPSSFSSNDLSESLAKITPATTTDIDVKISSCYLKAVGSEVIVEYYEALRRLSMLLNQALGDVLIPFLGEGIFTYAINFNDILFLGEFSQGVVVFSFYAIFFVILQVASSICRKVQRMKEWLYEKEPHLKLSCRQVALLLDSISRDSVGIAFSGIVTINYSLVGTLASILVTYFIIRLQYKE